MYHNTELLCRLFNEYRVTNLKKGINYDALGDAFEAYTVEILNNKHLLEKAKNSTLDSSKSDEQVFYLFFEVIKKIECKIGRNPNFVSLKASTLKKHRHTGGYSKTDVTVAVLTSSNQEFDYLVPISIKQTSATKVAMAEFDVKTIVEEVGITDSILETLLKKHQEEGSAKNFSTEEKKELSDHLSPISRDFVRWVITGTTAETPSDERYPDFLLKYQLDNQECIKDIYLFSTEEYINKIMYSKNGKRKKGGFGTGLSWTYATNSKGKKIQFKG
ncbi:MspI family type II restriction endonuclease [Butyrivibrio sp. AE2032]|uniref:MspI family type II restriction endonuclease n=1 Tax=Butyrivibrio sp. AE2032 TaxID=1458463 RepID=UPI00054CF689|nr:MspI family type II restriction endonuclease [Butyrivibrio sp. AE2032]